MTSNYLTLKLNSVHLSLFSVLDSPVLFTQLHLQGHGMAGLALRGFEISSHYAGWPLKVVPERPVRGPVSLQVLKGSVAAVTHGLW